jgi:hypothetical protein
MTLPADGTQLSSSSSSRMCRATSIADQIWV